MLDTNIFRLLGRSERDLPQQAERNVLKWFASVDADALRISVLTLRETRKGIELLRLKKGKAEIAAEIEGRLARLLADYGVPFVVPVDVETAIEWAVLSAEKDSDRMDMGIAATARAKGYVLVTRNVNDFRGRNLALLNPAIAPASIMPAKGPPTGK
nr:PIN domain-containing protein [Azospirillum sp. SYSU D00513]